MTFRTILQNKPLRAGPESVIYRMRKTSCNRTAILTSVAFLLLAAAFAGIYIHVIQNASRNIAGEQQKTLTALGEARVGRADAEEPANFTVANGQRARALDAEGRASKLLQETQERNARLLAITRAAGFQQRARAQLRRIVPTVTLDRVAFTETIDFLRDVTGCPIRVHWHTLETAGVDRAAAATVHAKSTPLADILDELLHSVTPDGSARWIVDDEGTIVITTHWMANLMVVWRGTNSRDGIPVSDVIDKYRETLGRNFTQIEVTPDQIWAFAPFGKHDELNQWTYNLYGLDEPDPPLLVENQKPWRKQGAARPASKSEPGKKELVDLGWRQAARTMRLNLGVSEPGNHETSVREALDICRFALPGNDEVIAKLLGSLGTILRTKGMLSEAEPLLRTAIEIRRRTLPSRAP